MTEIIEVHGLYARSWKGVLNEASFVHPAKISFNLAEYIYRFAMEKGMLEQGSTVLDPFGGICGTAFHAMVFGMSWYGVELEQKFVELGQANIKAWNKKYASTLPNWGSASLVQGDSRKLGEVLKAKCDATISSPPFMGSGVDKGSNNPRIGNKVGLNWQVVRKNRDNSISPNEVATSIQYGSTHGQLGNLPEGKLDGVISSPPHLNTPLTYEKNGLLEDGKKPYSRPYMEGNSENYGGNKENLGNLKEGSLDGTLDSVVSSPPYASARIGETSGAAQVGHGANYGSESGQLGGLKDEGFDEVVFDVAVSSPPYAESLSAAGGRQRAVLRGESEDMPSQGVAYSATADNLGNLPEGVFNAALSSPPYEGSIHGQDDKRTPNTREEIAGVRLHNRGGQISNARDYGNSDGQLSREVGDTFWSASKTIVSQVHSLLKPGGFAFFVVKNFVRKKAVVNFVGQWQQLCEACGFETLYEIRAWQVDEHGTQYAIDGNHKKLSKSKKSFFRRLHESKYPNTAIDYECVLVMKKVDHTMLFDPDQYHAWLPEWGTATHVEVIPPH